MVKFYVNKRVLSGFLVVLSILSGLTIYSYINTRELISTSQWISHTREVIYQAEQILASTSSLELGQRGYSLSGNKKFLEPYWKAQKEIPEHIKYILRLTADNKDQQKRIKKLQQVTIGLIDFTVLAVNKRGESFEAAQEVNAMLTGKILMDEVRGLINQIQNEENVLLNKRIEANDLQIQKFSIAFIFLIALIVCILIGLFLAINYNLKARIDSESNLKKALDEVRDLYDNAPCGYHSLDKNGVFVGINKTLLHWLGYQREEVIGKLQFSKVVTAEGEGTFKKNFEAFKNNGFVHNLEFDLFRKDGSKLPVVLSSLAIQDEYGNYVKSRTTTFDNTERKIAETKVRTLNEELEAFTYSVSHDLRAPLRSIDGYAKILQEDYGDKLDTEGVRVINVIMNNARRMGKLIDDLLEFSRLGRQEVSRVKIDMTSLVQNIARELIEQESERKISINIKPLHPSDVDMDMMRQVWINLISNAIKYTGKNDRACIEISSFERRSEVTYQVKDDGVGFDMQYVDKLFGVFQRLHKMQDFSGTGVGLALVKRIVARHSGIVWAEGKLNEGAKFYFTIPHNGKL
jgi:PAS domain S-box-containing protein